MGFKLICCNVLLKTYLFSGDSKENLNVVAAEIYNIKIQYQQNSFKTELRKCVLAEAQ